MGARESRLIIDLVRGLATSRNVSMIIIDHNFAHLFELCDRVNVMQGGRITIDQLTKDTSLEAADGADGDQLPLATAGGHRVLTCAPGKARRQPAAGHVAEGPEPSSGAAGGGSVATPFRCHRTRGRAISHYDGL